MTTRWAYNLFFFMNSPSSRAQRAGARHNMCLYLEMNHNCGESPASQPPRETDEKIRGNVVKCCDCDKRESVQGKNATIKEWDAVWPLYGYRLSTNKQTNKQRRKMNFYSNRLLIPIKEETNEKICLPRPICALWPLSLSLNSFSFH